MRSDPRFKLERLEQRIALSATELANDADTTLLLHMNNTLAGASGEVALSQSDITFQPGMIDQAAHVGSAGTVRYSTSGNIAAGAGTLEFWFKPDWNGTDSQNHYFFEVGGHFNNGTLMAIDGANNLRFIQWGDDPNITGVENNVERGVGASATSLVAGNWYHLAVTWDGASHQMAFYRNGALVQSANNAVTLAGFSTSFLTVGSDVSGLNSARATIDEFRISSRARTAAEIQADYSAGLGIVPRPEHPAAFALNHSVSIQWVPISNPQFDHYAIYRSQAPFISVAGMSPFAHVTGVNTSTFLDATAANGVSYFYAVTAVLTGGSESTIDQAIGPRTPRDELDLQVVSIARSPEFPRYSPEYAGHTITEASGFGPYNFSASTGLGSGQTTSDPRFPSVGQQVTYTATVRNRGTDRFQGSLPITWRLDGGVVNSSTPSVDLLPGATATFVYLGTWDDQSHELTFSMNIADARAANNSLASDPFAAPFLTYIDRTFVERFREEFTTSPASQNDDIIDWLNEHMTRFNELFSDSGSRQRVHYGVLEVLDDYQPLPAIDRSPYAIFPLRYTASDANPRAVSAYYHADDDIDYGLLHEMGHQLGLIDVYRIGVAPQNNFVSGQGYGAAADLMNGVSPFLSPFSALASDQWAHKAHGYFGQYLYDLPQTIQLKIRGFDGQPLPGATIKAYQVEDRPGLGQVITNQIKFQGITDANGILSLPNVSIDPALVPQIATGNQLHDNPFGYLDVGGTNGVLLFRVEYNDHADYAWLDVSEANVAYWTGSTIIATFERQLSLGGPVQTRPFSDLAELNAADWTTFAQNGTAHVEDDTTMKVFGEGSLKFVTDGGFDTYLQYPRTFSADWDLTQVQYMSLGVFAENANIGFQTDSDPIIRLRDADGNYFLYEYYVNGTPYPILNNALIQPQLFIIPLDASPLTTNGWRRTTLGTPNLAHIQSLEIHADTWGSGFTLWLDGIGFGPATVVDRKLFYNQSKFDGNNASVTAADDAAIATDKTPYIAGSSAANFGNVSSYTKGINGIMIDIAGIHGPITAADFTFRMGNNNAPSSWNAVVPAPTMITVRARAGINGSDRVEITWANNAISKNWLEVIVKGNDALGGNNQNTGLVTSDVFFWGSAPGDTGAGDTATRALVNATDELNMRGHQLFAGATVTNLYDVDRSGGVNATEQLFIRGNGTIAGNALWYINVAGAGPLAPEGEPEATPAATAALIDSDKAKDAVAITLARTPMVSASRLTEEARPGVWLGNVRSDSTRARSAAIVEAFEQMFATPGASRLRARTGVDYGTFEVDELLLDLLGKALPERPRRQ